MLIMDTIIKMTKAAAELPLDPHLRGSQAIIIQIAGALTPFFGPGAEERAINAEHAISEGKFWKCKSYAHMALSIVYTRDIFPICPIGKRLLLELGE